jgi:hypothetical protein
MKIDQKRTRRLTLPFATYASPRDLCAVLELLPEDSLITRAFDDYACGGLGLVIMSETFSPIADVEIPALKIIREVRHAGGTYFAEVPVRIVEAPLPAYCSATGLPNPQE